MQLAIIRAFCLLGDAISCNITRQAAAYARAMALFYQLLAQLVVMWIAS
jgi:hypothetical protein